MGDKAFSEKPIGSGPFMVKEWVRGQRLVLERNPHYWKEGQPYLDQIAVDYVPDENTRMLRVESGEAQIATEVPYSQLERIEALDHVGVQIEDVMAWDAVWFNSRKPAVQRSQCHPRVELCHAEGGDAHCSHAWRRRDRQSCHRQSQISGIRA